VGSLNGDAGATSGGCARRTADCRNAALGPVDERPCRRTHVGPAIELMEELLLYRYRKINRVLAGRYDEAAARRTSN
jgi:hypothetical protein